jgi:predicted GNAT family acetyltransferase
MDDVQDNSARSRYELIVDGYTAFVEYRLHPGVIEYYHTEVPKELGGRGIGSKLAAGVLAAARARGLKVKATCPFIAAYIKKNPDSADLA